MNAGTGQRPLISLVMIVRDEAVLVERSLRHHAPLYDEIVLVDTGSTDATVAVAAAAGARICHFEWCDDFAAARNYGIDAALGAWILTLDADEQIAARDFPALRAAARDGDGRCFLLTQRNYTDRTGHAEWRFVGGQYPLEEHGVAGYVEAFQVRLFPRRPEIRYRGCIHETVAGIETTGLRRNHLDLPIHHYGHLRGAGTSRRRDDLYARLTRQKYARDPDDGDACLQLATRYLEEGRPEQARALLARLVATGEPTDPAVARGQLLLGRILRQAGRRRAAAAAFAGALQARPEWLYCWTEVLDMQAADGRWSDLSRYLARAQELFPDEPRLDQLKCKLLVATGDYAGASEQAANLARRYPGWTGAHRLAERCRALVNRSDGRMCAAQQ